MKTEAKNTNTEKQLQADVKMSDGGDRPTDPGHLTEKRVWMRRPPTPENDEAMTVTSGEESVEDSKAKGKGKAAAKL